MIKAENIVKSYTNGKTVTEVLKGVSLEIDGGLCVILGASGSGKSTLLSVLSGLEAPDSGKVFCAGEEITAMTDKQRTDFRRRKVAFVFQQYFLLPHLTVEKNVKLGADLAGNKDYEGFIDAVELGDKKKKFPAELSGGEQQRVSIARALAKNPEVLFLDEPTGALDEKTGRAVVDYICRLQKEKGFTAVMVTHNTNLAEIADTVIKMNSGEIAEIYKNGAKKSAYEIGW
ncbi:MAG: ABC transporter ATP-binding protein [Clostridia bacterium]|nr:ABC transporter ATP-binding protein [Clostridia bacterium]